MKHLLAFVALSVAASTAIAQTDWNVLPADSAPRKMLGAYLRAEAQKHFDARRADVARLQSADDVRKRQATLKERMIEALGGFPDKTPLNGKVVGTEQRDGYRIEKIIYESRPNHHVTATLYLPNGKGPHPACIMPIGHSNNGKAADYVQRGSILLALNGIACLAYDPIGQGERKQWINDAGKSLIPSSTSEHSLVGVGAMLIGTSTATYRIWDGIRSLDYLETRPEIDAKRLGCTGCSGGGTLTSYLMALDDRIACAAPSCYITSLERLFATIGPQDAEQNIPGQVALGIEHADYLTMRAPRATLLATATQDFFDIGGSWTTFREATQIYGLMGHSERVNLVEYNTKHGYPKPQREAIVRWMSRWLLNKDVPIVEPKFAIASDADLQCTRSGQVLEDFKGKSVFHLNAEAEQELARQRAAKLPKQTREEILTEVRRLIGVPATIKPAKLRKDLGVVASRTAKVELEKAVFETEPGILVPALIFMPKAPRNLVLYVHGLGKAEGIDAIEKSALAGDAVIAVDLRGFGETSPGKPSVKPPEYWSDFSASFLSIHLNRPLLGQRVQDLLSIIASVRNDGGKAPLHVVGVQAAGPVVLHAAALDSRIESVALEKSVLSWAAVVRSPINYNQLTNVVPGALKAYDLPDLAALIAPRRLTIRDPWDPKWQPVSRQVAEEAHARAAQAYQKAGAKLAIETSP